MSNQIDALFVTNTEQIPCVCTRCFWDHWNKPNLGIQQVFRVFWFLEKLCRLYFDEHAMIVTDEVPTRQLENHKTIKKWQMTLRISLSILRFHNL
jgi:hypothetical protein